MISATRALARPARLAGAPELRRGAATLAVLALLLPLVVVAASGAPAYANAGLDQTISRNEVITRAHHWLARGVPYSQSASYPDRHGHRYRTDCSGFISMAWHLGRSLTTATLPDVSTAISRRSLRPGDILLRRDRDVQHVVLFERWTNFTRTQANIIAQANTADDMQYYRQAAIGSWSGYTAYRYNKIVDDEPDPPATKVVDAERPGPPASECADRCAGSRAPAAASAPSGVPGGMFAAHRQAGTETATTVKINCTRRGWRVSEAIEWYADLAAAALRAPPRLGTVRMVAVDGPAGAGKTTFAGRLAAALRAAGARVYEMHTDDILDGWTDVIAFWPRLRRWVLDPLRRGAPGHYRRYDWHRAQFEDAWCLVPVPDVLVLEGVTSARALATVELSMSIFVTADRQLRLARGLARDGEQLRSQWLRWMAEEEAHFAADATERRADLVVAGAPTAPHDPEREYLRLCRSAR